MAKKKTTKTAKAAKKATAKKATAKKATAKKATAKKATAKKAKKKNVKKAKPVAKKKSAVRRPSPKTALKKKPRKALTPRDKKVQNIRKKLVKQKDTLLSEAESALGQLPGQILFPDMGDQATAEIDRNFMLRLRGREQKLLKKIDDILDKIDSGSYGICEACGCEIEIKRLEARPVTSMCIECKTEQEDEEKLREL